MGTINYKTSDYITIGYDCRCINYDYDNDFDPDFIINDYDTVKNILDKYIFNTFDISLEYGYYQGFYINIKFDYLYFDDCTERSEAQKEITSIKKALLEIVNNTNCYAVFPGWCTGYADHKNTLIEIANAVKQMRQTVHDTPTYKQYLRGCKH